MSEALCREKLSVLFKNSLIDTIYVLGDKNSRGDFTRSCMTVVVDSKDRIKGLSLARLQSEIEIILETKIAFYELVELGLDRELKAQLMQNEPLVIRR